jgi:flagellin-like protein
MHDRGSSSVVGVVLMVGVVVILAAVVSVTVLSFTSDLRQPGPTVAQSSGQLIADQPGSDDQIVRLTHEAGDPIPVDEIEIVAHACGLRGRLVNLPASDGDPQPTGNYVQGDDLFDNSANSVSGPIGENDKVVDGRWTAGETAEFRIANGACSLDTGDTAVIRVVYTPTNSIVIEEELTAS